MLAHPVSEDRGHWSERLQTGETLLLFVFLWKKKSLITVSVVLAGSEGLSCACFCKADHFHPLELTSEARLRESSTGWNYTVGLFSSSSIVSPVEGTDLLDT